MANLEPSMIQPEPVSLGFLDRDEEIRATAIAAAAASQATGEYKPSARSVILIAKEFEEYIRYGK